MDVQLRRGSLEARPAGALAIGIPEGERSLSGAALKLDRAAHGAISALLRSQDFSGRFLDTSVLYPAGLKARRIILVGLGPRAQLDTHRARLAAAQATRRARELRVGTLALAIPGAGVERGARGGLDVERAAHAAAEGAVLGHYRHTAYRSDPAPPLERIDLVESDAATVKRLTPAVDRGARWGEAACVARDLANTPGQDLTPEVLADRALEIARQTGARGKALGVREMERLGMGALLGVGRGSANPPRLIALEHGPARASGTVVVIGKGVTFDTGGISLKPRENMHKMKYDMSGAAAVLGLFSALPTLDLPMRVVGIVAAAENMPGSRALKPGDVLRALDGTTIEVTNTDAEGRLVLADALGYSRRYEPEVVVDLATLTGAISIALGNLAAGLFTDDDALADELSQAGTRAGERLWRMPTWDDYAGDLKSDTADLLNSTGAREGGAIMGAMFLKRFARGMRWAHLDIASTAWSPTERPHEPRGATGFGVRLLLEWLSRREGAAGEAARGA